MAARLMRRILVDAARARHAQKRGDGVQVVSLGGGSIGGEQSGG